jgi:hypothetical protein
MMWTGDQCIVEVLQDIAQLRRFRLTGRKRRATAEQTSVERHSNPSLLAPDNMARMV